MNLEEKVQNLNENIRNYETKRFFQFREKIETRRNSDLFRTVSYFAKLKKKYETVNPISDPQ